LTNNLSIKGIVSKTTRIDVDIQALSPSIDPLIDHFNSQQDKLRFMVIFSPMCPK
jgi:hypothetical protein